MKATIHLIQNQDAVNEASKLGFDLEEVITKSTCWFNVEDVSYAYIRTDGSIIISIHGEELLLDQSPELVQALTENFTKT